MSIKHFAHKYTLPSESLRHFLPQLNSSHGKFLGSKHAYYVKFAWKQKEKGYMTLSISMYCNFHICVSGKPDASAETLLDQECINPVSYSSQLEDSGCDVSNDYAFDSLGIPSDFHQSEHNVDTSKCLLERVPPLSLCSTNKEKSLTAPVQFLQHLLEIRRLSEEGILQADFTELENDSFTIRSSVSQLLDGLTVFYNSPKFPVSDFLTEAVSVLISFITNNKLSNHVLKKCFKKLEEFKKNLIQIILRNSSVNRVSLKHLPSFLCHFSILQYSPVFYAL